MAKILVRLAVNQINDQLLENRVVLLDQDLDQGSFYLGKSLLSVSYAKLLDCHFWFTLQTILINILSEIIHIENQIYVSQLSLQ